MRRFSDRLNSSTPQEQANIDSGAVTQYSSNEVATLDYRVLEDREFACLVELFGLQQSVIALQTEHSLITGNHRLTMEQFDLG